MKVYIVTATKDGVKVSFVAKGQNSASIRDYNANKIREIFGSVVGVKTRIKNTKIKTINYLTRLDR